MKKSEGDGLTLARDEELRSKVDGDGGRGGCWEPEAEERFFIQAAHTTPTESGIKLSVRRTFDSNEKFSALPSFLPASACLPDCLSPCASTITFTFVYLNLPAAVTSRPPRFIVRSIGIGAKSTITGVSRRLPHPASPRLGTIRPRLSVQSRCIFASRDSALVRQTRAPT